MSRLDRERLRRILAEELGSSTPAELDQTLTQIVDRFASQPPRLPRPTRTDPATDPRIPRMLELRRQGLILQDIGDQFGLTRERVRQLLKLVDPDGTAIVEGKQAQQAAQARAQEQVERDWQATADPCRVCLGPRPYRRRNQINCSSECAELWRLCRFYLDEGYWQAHREVVARWTLNHPSQVSSYKLRFSRRVLDGTAGRRYVQPYSPTVLAGLARIRQLRSLHAGPGGVDSDTVTADRELGSQP